MLIDSNYWLYENMGVLFFIISCVFTFIKLIKEGNFLQEQGQKALGILAQWDIDGSGIERSGARVQLKFGEYLVPEGSRM